MGSLPALIAAAVALGTIQLGDDDIKDLKKTGIDAVDDIIEDLVDLRDNTYAATGERYIHCIYILLLLLQYRVCVVLCRTKHGSLLSLLTCLIINHSNPYASRY